MITKNVGKILEENVTLSFECMDRLYLNVYQPRLQYVGGVRAFFEYHRGNVIASPVLMARMTQAFVQQLKEFIESNRLKQVHFKSGQRKDEITQELLKTHNGKEGILYVGVAQEKFATFRFNKMKNTQDTFNPLEWMRSSVMCNQYYFYLFDDDFGPLFIKFSSYFPYTIRVNLNGHEFVKRQLEKHGIYYEALDNGVLSCEALSRLEEFAQKVNEETIRGVIDKWLERLPCPFTEADVKAGFTYDISILQSEFALTQVFEKPIQGRQFFESVMREHLDLGRPEMMSLIFKRRVTKRTPSRYQTRVITDDTVPSLQAIYKHTKIKQYFKEGRALRTETVINNARDFDIGKRLKNLPALQVKGFETNHRLLEAQLTSQNCMIGEEVFQEMTTGKLVDRQRVSGLKFGDVRVMAVLQALCMLAIFTTGFTNRMLKEKVTRLLGKKTGEVTANQMTYDLRRLKLHGIVERREHSNCYQITRKGMNICFFMEKLHSRLFRPGLSELFEINGGTEKAEPINKKISRALINLNKAMDQFIQSAQMTV